MNDNRPKKELKDWKKFELSHLCKNGLCINHKHLWWESKNVNQSRGYEICSKFCNHENCRKRLCVCQNIHLPSCINKKLSFSLILFLVCPIVRKHLMRISHVILKSQVTGFLARLRCGECVKLFGDLLRAQSTKHGWKQNKHRDSFSVYHAAYQYEVKMIEIGQSAAKLLHSSSMEKVQRL